MQTIIETERTLIRALLPEDDQGMYLLDSDPEVHRYLNNDPVKSIEQVQDVIEFVRQQYVDNGIGRWAMVHKETGDFIGWIGFKLMKETVNGLTDFIDFGYRLRRTYWNKGYATEGSLACMRYAQDVLGYETVYAMTDPDNGASRRVLEKVGFEFTGIFDYEGKPGWWEETKPITWYVFQSQSRTFGTKVKSQK